LDKVLYEDYLCLVAWKKQAIFGKNLASFIAIAKTVFKCLTGSASGWSCLKVPSTATFLNDCFEPFVWKMYYLFDSLKHDR